MPVTTDIAATYRRPRAVMRRLLARPGHEGRALAILMAGCVVVFIGQWPRLAREAHLSGQELNMLLGGALLPLVFMLPLFFYTIAFFSYLVQRILGGKGEGYSVRLALFWAFLASSPLSLLRGLVAGFIGPGTELFLTELMYVGVFLWFWLSNLREAGWGTS